MRKHRTSVRDLFKRFPGLSGFVTTDIETLKEMSTDIEQMKNSYAVTLHNDAEQHEIELIEEMWNYVGTGDVKARLLGVPKKV